MKRRAFMSVLGGAAAWPLAARAQRTAMPVVGFLSAASAERFADRVRAFRSGLAETGHVEGKNVAIEFSWANYRSDRLPAMADELVRRPVDVIAATGGFAIRAAKAATSTIPIVFYIGADPVEAGHVANLNRPGGNLTGVSNMVADIGPKRLELLHELVPTAKIIGVLVNPVLSNAERQAGDLQAAARRLGVQAHVLHASSEQGLDAAFANLVRLQAGALVIGADLFFSSRTRQLAELTARHALPAVHVFREFTVAGGLMSYGSSFTDSYHQVGIYAGRVLKGERPADLPVQQTTKVQLVINLKTAKALGLTVPLPLLGRADEVIE